MRFGRKPWECPEMKGGHCLREEFLHSKNIEAIAKQIAIKLLEPFHLMTIILANPLCSATEKTLLPNNAYPSSVAGKPICYSRGFEKKCVLLPLQMKTAYNLPQKWYCSQGSATNECCFCCMDVVGFQERATAFISKSLFSLAGETMIRSCTA